MCNQAPLEDAEIKVLCQNIISGQQAESSRWFSS